VFPFWGSFITTFSLCFAIELKLQDFIWEHLIMTNKTIGNLLVLGQFVFIGVLFGVPPEPGFSLAQELQAALALVSLAGVAILLISFVNLGKSLTANPVPLENSTLKTSGLYSIVRHPIYLGLILLAVSAAIQKGGWIHVTSAISLLVLLSFKARFEERMLLEKFDGYAAYSAKVGRMIPLVGRLR
jgi:protein-S-isoprenylcysteine O-methyltransferase Ste14